MNIAIDLDGTLTSWERGPSHQGNGIGPWLPGAREAIRAMLDAGHHVIVHTCRATWEAGGSYAGVRHFLDSHGFEDVEVWHDVGKPIAHVYIDDRAIPFQGEWGEVMMLLRGSAEWHRRRQARPA